MKFIAVIFFFTAQIAHSQTATLKDIKTDEDTTISIKKGKDKTPDKIYELVNGTSDIEGETELLKKDAKASWKTACKEWKQEKSADKENPVVSMDCNSPTCSSDANGTICKSTGTFLMKTKMVH